MARSVSPKQVVDQILSSSVTRFGINGKVRELKASVLGHLVLQSVGRFVKRPESYGRNPRSLDAALKSVFTQGVLIGDRRQRHERMSRLKAILEAYERHEDRSKIAKIRIGRSSLPAYLRRKSASGYVQSVADMQMQKVGRRPLLQPEFVLPPLGQTESWRCRRLRAQIASMGCVTRSEYSADELYLLTGSMLVDDTGVWESSSSPASDVVSNPGNNQPVPLPNNPYIVHDWRIQDPPDTYSTLPLLAVATVTLMEQDQSDKDRVAAAVRAAYGAVRLLASAGGAGPVGIAISLLGILINFLTALDGDDHLGTQTFRFEDVLDDEFEEYVGVQKLFNGKNGPDGEEKDFCYKILIYNRTMDSACPDIPPFRISGPTQRTIPYVGGMAKGGYRLIAPFPIKQGGIRWRASPTGTTIGQNGNRYASFSFHSEGAFTLSVEAERVDGEVFTASLGVQVTQSDGGFEYYP